LLQQAKPTTQQEPSIPKSPFSIQHWCPAKRMTARYKRFDFMQLQREVSIIDLKLDSPFATFGPFRGPGGPRMNNGRIVFS
jgi:hypothetical protein